MTRPIALLRLEGLVVLVISVGAYMWMDGGWWFFALLFLLPDLSMVGYMRDDRIGAAMYNVVHSYVGPALVGGAAYWMGRGLVVQIAVIWVSHIALDRLLGFGLKHPSGFGDTHLGTST